MLYASPEEASHAAPEEFLYLACLHEGTGVREPDFLAVVDAEDGRIIHETPMPNVGDELHHFGWNRCSSACHGPDRSHLILPGLPLLADPHPQRRRRPAAAVDREGDRARRARRETGLHATAHGPLHAGRQHRGQHARRRDGNGAGGFAVIDARTFELKGRWENGGPRPPLNYDFWYQPRKNVLVSSEFGEPNAYEPGFDIADVAAGRYGSGCTSGTWASDGSTRRIDLGEAGLVPLEVRWLHDPDATEGFVGAALSSNIFRWHRANGAWEADQVIAVDNVELEGWPLPGGVPGLITDLVVSMDDRFLYSLELAARRPPAIRHLRPRQAAADRPAMARRIARQAGRRRPRTERRARR